MRRRAGVDVHDARARTGARIHSCCNPSDHICIIGNTLAERMQYDGWLETLLHARFPKHDLVIRNLGFSGDEIADRASGRRTSARPTSG